jgi:hypothetical protein
VPAPKGFQECTVADFLKDLRDAVAHGDARNVVPFNIDRTLAGFTFRCSRRHRGASSTATITLLEGDMRRIGMQLGKQFCDALAHRDEGNFGAVAASLTETAA